MKKVIIALMFLPLISCGKTKSAAPETTVETVTEVQAGTDVKSMDHSKWNALLQKNVTKSGKVKYSAFRKDSKELSSYLSELAANVPTSSTSRKATLAYWINAYNAYTVKLIIDNYPVKSIKDIKDPWGTKFFTLGNKKYSLEEIEHQILRKMDEPRIHFAINCASFSCPNLLNEAYTEANLESQLNSVTKSFINDKSKNTITASKIEISKIFDWFGDDFKKKGSIIDFFNKYSAVKINSNAKISFKDYNWSLNE